jgi:hypothetical protein
VNNTPVNADSVVGSVILPPAVVNVGDDTITRTGPPECGDFGEGAALILAFPAAIRNYVAVQPWIWIGALETFGFSWSCSPAALHSPFNDFLMSVGWTAT